MGDYCLEKKKDCLLHNNLEVCWSCDVSLVGDECNRCESIYYDSAECFPLIPTFYGNYIKTSQITRKSGKFQIMFYDDIHLCDSGFVEEDKVVCEICSEEFSSINGSCHIIQPETTTKFHGELCSSPFDSNKVSCNICFEGFSGTLCNFCQEGFAMYENQCYRKTDVVYGLCLNVSEINTCVSCNKGYVSTENHKCQKIGKLPGYVIPLTVTLGVLLIVFLVIIAGLQLFRRTHLVDYLLFRNVLIRTTRRALLTAGLMMLA